MTTTSVRPGEYEAMLQARLAEARTARLEARRSARARRRLPIKQFAVLSSLLATAIFATLVAAVVVNDGGTCNIEVADRLGYDTCTTNAGGTVEYLGDQNTTFGSAGTGTFNSFVRIQADGSEQGYNTDATPELDTKTGNFTHSILVSDIPVVSIGGNLYWELFADINDSDNTPLISLNDIEVYFTDDAELTGYPFAAADAEPIYDFDGEILINDVNQGSGRGDLRLRIPLADIEIPEDCDYANEDCMVYFVLYSQWGTTGGAYTSDGGFEEWKVKQYPTIKIVKNAIGGDGTFDFTVTGTPTAPPDTSPSIITSGGTGSTITYIVEPGTYTIAEDGPPAGWTFNGATCSINGGSASAYIEGSNLVLGETTHVVCTFTNTRDAHIIVDKVTNPSGSPQSFSFDASGGSYADFSLTDAATPNDQTLPPGTYGVSETVPAGWDLTSATCSDGSPVTAIALSAGETVTCTFTNTQRGHIIVDKVTIPSGSSQSFSFDASGGSYADFSLTDAAAPNNQTLVPGTYAVSETVPAGWALTSATCNDGSPVTAIVLSAGETVTCTFTNTQGGHIIVDKVTNPSGSSQSFSFDASGGAYADFSLTDAATPNDQALVPGSYSVSETVPAGWDLTSAVCDDDDSVVPSALTLDPGETITCTFTNTQRGHIIVDKVTDPSGDPQSFSFDASGGTYGDFSLTDAAAPNNQELVPGTYAVSETVPAGWDLTSAVCDDGSPVTAIVLSAGETVTCTFTNTKQPVGEGCTPGFWKTHTDLWDSVGSPDLSPTYDPGDDFYTVFGITVADGGALPDTLTLEGALNLQGGGILALARHAAAAIVNSDASLAYPYTTAQVINIFRDGINASTATPPDDYTLQEALSALQTANELGCPFGAGGTINVLASGTFGIVGPLVLATFAGARALVRRRRMED